MMGQLTEAIGFHGAEHLVQHGVVVTGTHVKVDLTCQDVVPFPGTVLCRTGKHL